MQARPMILVQVVLFLALSVGGATGPTVAADDDSGASQPQPAAVFPQTQFTFQPVFKGEDIKHDFVVENTGDAPLVIKNVRPG